METLKHIAWALALLVIAGVISLSFETAWMENYTFGLIIAGVVALSILANKQFNLLKMQLDWKEKALDKELDRKKEWAEFEKSLYQKDERKVELEERRKKFQVSETSEKEEVEK